VRETRWKRTTSNNPGWSLEPTCYKFSTCRLKYQENVTATDGGMREVTGDGQRWMAHAYRLWHGTVGRDKDNTLVRCGVLCRSSASLVGSLLSTYQAALSHRRLNRQVHGSTPAPCLEVPVRHHAAPEGHGATNKDDHRPKHVYEDRARTSGLLR